jgi:hypothetical protein
MLVHSQILRATANGLSATDKNTDKSSNGSNKSKDCCNVSHAGNHAGISDLIRAEVGQLAIRKRVSRTREERFQRGRLICMETDYLWKIRIRMKYKKRSPTQRRSFDQAADKMPI